MNTCRKCNRQFLYQKNKGHTKTLCNSCITNKWRTTFKEKCVLYLGGKCITCGYSKNFAALDFHHTNPETKDFEIGSGHTRKFESIKQELDKCILLCSNCHRELHAIRA
jgi:hypothetical protein